jgi:hypothetical protein
MEARTKELFLTRREIKHINAKRGRRRHTIECKSKEVVCYNCRDAGHISTKCSKPKKEKSGRKVFALNVDDHRYLLY